MHTNSYTLVDITVMYVYLQEQLKKIAFHVNFHGDAAEFLIMKSRVITRITRENTRKEDVFILFIVFQCSK